MRSNSEISLNDVLLDAERFRQETLDGIESLIRRLIADIFRVKRTPES